MRASTRPKAVAVLAEGRIKNGLQHLQQRLLDQTIRHRRDAELALAALWLEESSPVAPDWAGTSPATVAHGSRATPYADGRRSGQCPDRPHRLRLCWPALAAAPVAGSLSSVPPEAALTPCSPVHAAGGALRRCPGHTRLHRLLPRAALLAQASDAVLATSACC
jgi:hypothetical protein